MSRTRQHLYRLRRRAAFGLWLEGFSHALAPCCGILLAYLIAALFGFGSPWVFAAVLLLAASSLLYGLARLRRPRLEEIDRRIERASGLRHRPIAMLEDVPETDSALAAVIWQIHQRRTEFNLRKAIAGRPAIGAAIHDPYALRAFLLLLLLAGFIIAGPAAPMRLAAALSLPGWPLSGPGVNAWITQPAYTGTPPLVLSPGDNPVVLAGSRLTVVVNGQAYRAAAVLGGRPIRFSDLAQDSFRADVVLRASARLRIGPWWHSLARWNLTVLPPEKPRVSMGPPMPAGHQLLITWQAQDPYGLASLSASLAPIGHAQALPEMLDLPLNSPDLKNAGGLAKPDISDSPYAGLQVTVLLAASNLAGLTGTAKPLTVRLPPPDLQDKTAVALAGLRQRLALHPGKNRNSGEALQKLAQAPPSQISFSADLQMAMLAQQLSNHEIPADAAQKRMAILVRQIEDGPDYGPAQALAAANQALEQALRQAMNAGNKLEKARLQNLLAALHDALARHLQALGPSASATSTPSMNTADLDRLAEQIAQDEAAGQTAKAASELNRLKHILADLQSAKPMSAAQAKRAQAAEQAAQALATMMRGESTLLDQTNLGTATAGAQTALQRQLSATRQGLAKADISLPGLGDAAGAMSAADGALASQDTGTATTAEGNAVQSLQQAAAALAASQGMSFGESSRPQAGGNEDGDDRSGAPDEDSIPGILPSGNNPAGAIQHQIIRNDDNPALPSAAHQYYHRLLDQDAN